MSYTIDRMFSGADIDDIDARTRVALTAAGFLPGYRILGACNPNMAWQAIGMEPRVGAMLPCNVIVRETDEGVEVSAVDPVVSMTGINNQELGEVAGQVRQMLEDVVSAI